MNTSTTIGQALPDDYQFPSQGAGKGELLEGMFPATLLRIEAPQTTVNEQGEEMTSSRFVWAVDGYPDYEQYSFANPYGVSERSNMYKLYKALTGKPIDRRNPPRVSEMLNRRCNLICEEHPKKPGYTKVTGYAPLARPRPAARPAAPPPADDLESEFEGQVPF